MDFRRHGLRAVAVLLALATAPVLGQDAPGEDAGQLRERVRQLEQRLERVEQQLAATATATTKPAAAAAADSSPEAQRATEQAKARVRMRADAAKFSADDLRAAEALYQVANKNWRTAEARQSLETMIEKYPDVNRTGCAVLYLGQMSEGTDRERYLTRAVEKHGDCFYGDGVQVGAYGRYLLALYHRDNGRPDQAAALFNEILEKYPTAITHRGEPLATIVTAEMAVMPTTRPAK